MKSDYMAKIKTGAMANVGFLKEIVKVYLMDVLFFLKDFGFHYAVTWAFFFPLLCSLLQQICSGCTSSAAALR